MFKNTCLVICLVFLKIQKLALNANIVKPAAKTFIGLTTEMQPKLLKKEANQKDTL